MNLIDKKIAFLGDSITEGAGVSKIENEFWKRVAERTGAKAYGYGVGGRFCSGRLLYIAARKESVINAR